MPWQSPPIGGQQRARPPREGLPPFPTGRGEQPGGVFARVPPELRGRPVPEPPDIPSPGVVLRTGERANRSSVIDPVNLFAYGAAAAAVYALVRKARASGAEPQMPQQPAAPPPVPVDPALQQLTFEAEKRRLDRASRMDLRTEVPFLMEQLDELLFGHEKSFALSKVLGGIGQGGKVQVEAVKRFLVGSAAGGGEEDAIMRLNDQLKAQRALMAARIFAALGFVPGAGIGGPGGFTGPQEKADP